MFEIAENMIEINNNDITAHSLWTLFNLICDSDYLKIDKFYNFEKLINKICVFLRSESIKIIAPSLRIISVLSYGKNEQINVFFFFFL